MKAEVLLREAKACLGFCKIQAELDHVPFSVREILECGHKPPSASKGWGQILLLISFSLLGQGFHISGGTAVSACCPRGKEHGAEAAWHCGHGGIWATRNSFGTTLGVKGPLQGHQNHSRTTCNQNGTNWGHSGITRAMLGPAMTTLQPPMVKLGQPQGHLGLPWGREQPHWDHPWLNWNQLGPHWCDQGYRGTDSSQTGTTCGQTGTTWGLRWGQRRPNWGHPSSV